MSVMLGKMVRIFAISTVVVRQLVHEFVHNFV